MTESNKLPSGRTRIDNMQMQGISKKFPGVIANDHVDFDVKSGEVHALLGENGAGKSTLMKILYGMYHPDEGQILLNGSPVSIASPTDAINLGIGMIHQHFMLVPTLTVAENVALGLPSSRGPAHRPGPRLGTHRRAGRDLWSEDRPERLCLAAFRGTAAARGDHQGSLSWRCAPHPG